MNNQKNRIDTMFENQKKYGKKSLITFLTAGDPDLETSSEMILEMERQGANLIEIGIPFSDPIAEGQVIQAANERALENGTTVDRLFDMIADLRTKTQIPLVYLLYYNTLYQYGLDKFFARCAQTGIDGLIIPDLPFEESDEVADYVKKYNVYQIMLLAPTSMERLAKICKNAQGFLYCVSSLGVTGMRSRFAENLEDFLSQVKSLTDLPYCVGFGISTAKQAEDLSRLCDGIIVGSAFVNCIAHQKDPLKRKQEIAKLTASLREGVNCAQKEF